MFLSPMLLFSFKHQQPHIVTITIWTVVSNRAKRDFQRNCDRWQLLMASEAYFTGNFESKWLPLLACGTVRGGGTAWAPSWPRRAPCLSRFSSERSQRSRVSEVAEVGRAAAGARRESTCYYRPRLRSRSPYPYNKRSRNNNMLLRAPRSFFLVV